MELTKAFDECNRKLKKKHYKLRQFIKLESYTKFNYPRGIRARSDVFKCVAGPIFKAIEEVLYKSPHFIKHVPVPQRPAYIIDLLNRSGYHIVATDYTSFEALFSKEIMQVCEMQLYIYMLKNVNKSSLYKIMSAMLGINTCFAGNVEGRANMIIRVLARRMSGEMCTSLGNGFTNLMVFLFLCSRRGMTVQNGGVNGVVEGDDGLFVCRNEPPTSEEFEELGFFIKIEKHNRLNEASFCGLVFDPDDLSNLADPAELLAKFGWTASQAMHGKPQKMKELLKAKAYSLAYELPRCPIAQALARYALRCSKNARLRFSGFRGQKTWWEEQIFGTQKPKLQHIEKEINRPIPVCNRLIVERVYGVSVCTQHAIETYLDSLDVLTPLDNRYIYELMKPQWAINHDLYLVSYPAGRKVSVL